MNASGQMWCSFKLFHFSVVTGWFVDICSSTLRLTCHTCLPQPIDRRSGVKSCSSCRRRQAEVFDTPATRTSVQESFLARIEMAAVLCSRLQGDKRGRRVGGVGRRRRLPSR